MMAVRKGLDPYNMILLKADFRHQVQINLAFASPVSEQLAASMTPTMLSLGSGCTKVRSSDALTVELTIKLIGLLRPYTNLVKMCFKVSCSQ